MIYRSRVTILVKASPQPSKKHSETVCCAGIDSLGHWKRLFPIRFRQLSDDQSFKRWSVVDFKYSPPTSDPRKESCRVHEESIRVAGYVRDRAKRSNLVNPCILSSEVEAMDRGESLAVIRPENVSLRWRRITHSELESARAAFEAQARQAAMFDKKLDLIEPCPFEFRLRFKDGDGKQREKRCSDWETSATFFKLSKEHSESYAIRHLEETYCQKYVQTGLVLALGNMAKKPRTWQLLGIFPLPQNPQSSFNL